MRPIPCFLTAFNLLSPLREMVAQLMRFRGLGPVVIVDNGSTYGPLLDWYKEAEQMGFDIVRLTTKATNHAVFTTPLFKKLTSPKEADFFFVSDGDLGIEELPGDAIVRCAERLNGSSYMKVGFALRTHDLPNCAMTRYVKERESEHWKTRDTSQTGDIWYVADIDTTAAVYRAGDVWRGYGPALRGAGVLTARHVPWYMDPERYDQLDEEWRYFADHLNPRVSSWGWHLPQDVKDRNGRF